MPKYTSFPAPDSLVLKGNSIDFSTENAVIMGILNLTSNSFYDGGKYLKKAHIIKQCKKMLEEGAHIIDIGAQSSRPGAATISAQDELIQILPVIKLLKSRFPKIIISIDTYWAKVAAQSIQAGAHIINDISAGELDKDMFDTIAELQVPYIIMHMQGSPSTMQNNPTYHNVTKEVTSYFREKIQHLKNKGVKQIIIDPGFGFGKTLTHNYQLLNDLEQFNNLGVPLLVGVSRKSMIYKILDTEPEKALNGTSVINTIALLKGAHILRVHDVKEAVECIKITTFAKNLR